MNIEEQLITKYDLVAFNRGDQNTKVHKIWEDIISSFPIDIKNEAQSKGFYLKKMDDSMGLSNFIIEANNPSKELEHELLNHNLFIISVND